MNRRVTLSLGLLLSALVCLTSIGGTFASWSVSDDTVNKLSIADVQGEIVEQYTDGLAYMPGATVTKIVNIKNTGTADSIIRVKLTPAWGDARNNDGTLIINGDLPADSVHINCPSELWHYDATDGYYYYKGVLAPGETTLEPVMDSFTLSPTLGNDYAGKHGDIRVDLECLQAGENSVTLWNKTLDELSIEYTTEYEAPKELSVFFKSPAAGFDFDAAQGDLFANFKQLVPGEQREQTLHVKNTYDELTEITLRAEFFDDDLPAEDRLLAAKLLKELCVVTITDSTGKTVYSGAVWDNDEAADSMKSRISLGVYPAGDEKDFTVSLFIKPETDNTYRSLISEVKWVFESGNASSANTDVKTTEPATEPTTEPATEPKIDGTTTPSETGTTSTHANSSEDPSPVPKLGDSSVTAGFAATAVISGSVFFILLSKRSKNDEKDKKQISIALNR